MKYFIEDDSLFDQLQIDKSMIREYERSFEAGRNMDPIRLNDFMAGRVKMNVLNKCSLLGWYYNSLYDN